MIKGSVVQFINSLVKDNNGNNKYNNEKTFLKYKKYFIYVNYFRINNKIKNWKKNTAPGLPE